jgi:RNA polymerase sigma factor (sigma-70 family)
VTPRSLLAPARLAGHTVLRTQSDERLVDLVRAGHAGAFEAVVARYRRPLLRHASRILPAERAEDAVQQAFLRAYDAMLAGDAELKLRPWLYRITHNTALNALRDRDLRHEQLSESLDGVERPDQVVERRQGLAQAVAAVRALPHRQRHALVLRELEGRSYEEIAAEMGVTDGAVRQLLNRARAALRAGASAVTPGGLLARIPWGTPSEGLAARVAELCGGAGAGAALAKACATAVVTGAIVGGVAGLPAVERGKGHREGPAAAGSVAHGKVGPGAAAEPTEHGSASRLPGSVEARDESGSRGPGSGSDDRSGPGDRLREAGDGSSGPSSQERSGSSDDSSGSDDRSGSGDLDSSGPGSGELLPSSSGTSGSGSAESVSSGPGESGSGTYYESALDDSLQSSGSTSGGSGPDSGSGSSSGSGEPTGD